MPRQVPKGLALSLTLMASTALLPRPAAASAPVTLTLKNHRFTPAQVTVPAGQRFRIEVLNQDTTPAEFESGDLRVEKIVVPGGRIAVNAGPLRPGSYKFFDDYHPDATGTITATGKKD